MAQRKSQTLKRTVGVRLLTLYGIGNIVGAGVYVLIGKIAEPAGYLSVIAFLLAALVAFAAALSYAELAARFPVSAGISVYLYEAFRAKRLSTVIGIFLIVAGAISTATLLKGFSGYFYELIPLPPPLIMATAMFLLLAVMLKGIKESVSAAAILTIIEVGGLLFLVGSIIWSQPQALGEFNLHFSESLSDISFPAIAGVISAAFIAFYAFIGFEDMVNIAEEVKRPQKAFPIAILIAMATVTLLYVAVAIATLGILTPQQLGLSSAPLADAFETATGNAPGIIVVISLLATLNGIIVNVVMGSRFLYGLAKRGWIPAWFAKVSGSHVPARGLVSMGVIALIAASLVPLEFLAQTTSMLLLFVFLAVNVSLIVIRRRDTEESRRLRVSPSAMPWFGAIASGALLVSQVVI